VVVVSPEVLPELLSLLQATNKDKAAAVTKIGFMLCVLKCYRYDIA
jgi:vesicle coat complex subunit